MVKSKSRNRLQDGACAAGSKPCTAPHSPRSDSKGYIVGIDPGLNRTGYAILRSADGRLEEAGLIRPVHGPLPLRLYKLHEAVRELLGQYAPAELALEELFSHYAHPRTAILMGHARGVICLVAAEKHVEVFSYGATHIKRIITGSGRATKSQMQQAICHQLRLPAVPQPSDVADALAVAVCHWYKRRNSSEAIGPVGRRTALPLALT